jgi:hypothetical protein
VRLPDLAVGFAGDVGGYGRLARALLGLERILRAQRPTTVFRCHQTARGLRLVGDVPLEEVVAIAGLARVGTGLGMRVSCTAYLPRRGAGLRHLPVLAGVGGVGALTVDLSGADAAPVDELRAAVGTALDHAEALGLDVEVRGAIPVIRAAGVLRAQFLDRHGVTVRPDTAAVVNRARSSVELFFTVDGRWYRDEAAWRGGEPAIGSVDGQAGEVVGTLRAALVRWRDLSPDNHHLEGVA